MPMSIIEISSGFIDSIDSYAYRMPIAPPIGIEAGDDAEDLGPDDTVGELGCTVGDELLKIQYGEAEDPFGWTRTLE